MDSFFLFLFLLLNMQTFLLFINWIIIFKLRVINESTLQNFGMSSVNFFPFKNYTNIVSYFKGASWPSLMFTSTFFFLGTLVLISSACLLPILHAFHLSLFWFFSPGSFFYLERCWMVFQVMNQIILHNSSGSK